jgi:hypothetical protein
LIELKTAEQPMSTQVEINAGMAQFKVDLSEFVSAMKRLVAAATGAKEKEQAREAMKELLSEARKTFDTVVEAIAPLRAITTEREFAASFAAKHAEVTRLYMDRKTLTRTHCGIVETAFNKLQQRRAWMNNLPLAQTANDDLRNVCGRWLFQDWKIVRDMEVFLTNLDKFMSNIVDLSRVKPSQGFQAFRDGMSSIENNFFDLKNQVGELDALARQL